MMLKLLLFVSLLVITDAGRIHSRIINRVIHIESMLTRGRWLVDNSYRDADGSYYLYVDQVSERNTYYSPKTQFKVWNLVDLPINNSEGTLNLFITP